MTTRVVEISADSVAGVRSDVGTVRDTVEAEWVGLRARARTLGVTTTGFDDALDAADRLGTHVLPVVDTHLERARALEDLRYGAIGGPIPVLDVDPAPVAQPFTRSLLGDGSTTLTWEPTDSAGIEADEQEARESRGIGGWFSERWDEVSGAVEEGTDWVVDRAAEGWKEITDLGASIGDWWERTTADLGGWIDENLAGVREFIGRHVGIFRFLADALRIIGMIVIVVGAVLTVVLGVVGGLVGFGAGTFLGGPAGVPAGVAGAAAGAGFGLKILGAGFTLYSLGDFLDVAADWGEGKIDGQELVKRGAVELALAGTSLIGVGIVGKILQKGVKHLPASWRRRIEEWIASSRRSRDDAPQPAPVTPVPPRLVSMKDITNQVPFRGKEHPLTVGPRQKAAATHTANRAAVEREIGALNAAGFTVSRSDLTKRNFRQTLKRLEDAISADGSLSVERRAELLDQVDRLQNALRKERSSLTALQTASADMGEAAGRDALRSQGADIVVDGAGAGNNTFDIVGLTKDGLRLIFVEAKGGGAKLSEQGRKLPDGTRAPQGSPAYMADTVRVDKELQQWLKDNPAIVQGIRNGTVSMQYQLVHADAKGAVKIHELTIDPALVPPFLP